MKATLTRVGPFGVQTDQTGDKWLSNGGKHPAVKDIKNSFKAGDVVNLEYVENGQYLNLRSMVKDMSVAPVAVAMTTPVLNGTARKTSPEDALRMTKASVIASVYSSPLLAELLKTVDLSEAVSTLREIRDSEVAYVLGETKNETTTTAN